MTKYLGKFARERVRSELMESGTGSLQKHERRTLWRLFQAIGEIWETAQDRSASLHSQWLEFVELRVSTKPSYLEEYRSAVMVVDEMADSHGLRRAFEIIFLGSGEPSQEPANRFEHLKTYVASEFIKVHLSSGGFEALGAKNYRGYIGGSRFRNRVPYNSDPLPPEYLS